MYEELYLFLTHGRSTESEKLTVKLDHQLKKTADFNPSLSALRSEVLISGLVDNNLDDLNSALNDFKDELVFTGKTERALKDLSLVNAALKRVQQAHPDWKINPFGDPWAKKETEKDEED